MTDLAAHCQRAAREVATWPEWKRNVLGVIPMANETNDEWTDIQVQTKFYLNISVRKSVAQKIDKESLSATVQYLIDQMSVRAEEHAGCRISELGSAWDEIPPDEFEITCIETDDWPKITKADL